MRAQNFPRITGNVNYGTGDSSKTLLAKSTNILAHIKVTRIEARVVTSAAQVVTVKDTSGTIILLRIPASATVGSEFTLSLESGIALTANEDLIAAGTAGPAIDFQVEGYYDGFKGE